MLERNPNAFRPKIAATALPPASPIGAGPGSASIGNSLIGPPGLNMGNIAFENLGSAMPISQQNNLELTPKGNVAQGKHSKVSHLSLLNKALLSHIIF